MKQNKFRSIKGVATAGQIKRGLMFASVTEVELE